MQNQVQSLEVLKINSVQVECEHRTFADVMLHGPQQPLQLNEKDGSNVMCQSSRNTVVCKVHISCTL